MQAGAAARRHMSGLMTDGTYTDLHNKKYIKRTLRLWADVTKAWKFTFQDLNFQYWQGMLNIKMGSHQSEGPE